MDSKHLAGKRQWLILGIVLIIISAALSTYMIIVAAERPLTALEVALFQVLSLGVGLLGALFVGRFSAAEAARDVIRPHARSALRTTLSLRDSLFRLSRRIEEFKRTSDDHRFDIVQAIVHEQIPIGGSAVEDWRDIVPEDVEEVLERWGEETEVSGYGNAD